MSRSYKKTPIRGDHAGEDSEKKDKQCANRRYRRAVNVALCQEQEPPQFRQISHDAFSKGRKEYIDPKEEPKAIRK